MYSVLDLQKLVQMLSFLGISPGASAPAHSVVLGAGTYAAPGTAGYLLASNGATADPSFQSLASLGVNGIGAAAHAVVLGANTTVPIGASGTIFSSTGTGADPSYRTLSSLGILPVNNPGFAGSMNGPSLLLNETANGVQTLVVENTGSNGANMRLIGNGTITPSKYIRATGGAFQIVNDGYSSVILSLSDAGDMTIGGHMASDYITFQQPGSGGVRRTLTQWLNDRMISAMGFGAVGDGVTDDAAAIQNALNSAPAGWIVALPPPAVAYRLASGITVPAGKALMALSYGTSAGAGSCELLADLSVATIVTIDGGAASQACGLPGITVTRAAGAVPAGSVGVLITDCNNGVAQDIFSIRSAIGIAVIGTSQANSNIQLLRCVTSQVTQYHVQIQNSVGITFTDCWFGRNGGLDVSCTAYVNINGGAVDTVRFMCCQFNQTGQPTSGVLAFTGYASDVNGIITFAECHMEAWSSYVVSADSTSTNILRIKFTGCTVNGTGQFYNGAANNLLELMLTGNTFDGAISLTLDQQNSSIVTGNNISGTVLVNAGSQVISGNYFDGNVTLQGASVKTIFVGNAVGGTLTNTMTGTFAIANNA